MNSTQPYSRLQRVRYKSPDDFEAHDARRMLPRFNAENFSKNVDLVKIFEDLAAKKGAPPPSSGGSGMDSGPVTGILPYPGDQELEVLGTEFGGSQSRDQG